MSYEIRSIHPYFILNDQEFGITLVPSGLSLTGQITLRSETGGWVVQRGQDTAFPLNIDGRRYDPRGISPNGRWCVGVTSTFRPPCKNNTETAFLFDRNSDSLTLFSGDKPQFRQAYAVNDQGRVVGFGRQFFNRETCKGDGTSPALFWDGEELLELPGGRPYSISGENIVLGRVSNVASLLEPGSDTITTLELPADCDQSVAYVMDSSKTWIAGAIRNKASQLWHPVIWSTGDQRCHPRLDEDGEMPLGLALGVNASGLAIGVRFSSAPRAWGIYHAMHKTWPKDERNPTGEYEGEAFYCPPEGSVTDMSGWFGPTILAAAHLTDDGWFLGHYQHKAEGGARIRPISAQLHRRS